MIIKNVELETIYGVTSKPPKNIHPEFAFARKSSVEKSSLIDALMNHKSYTRTSSQSRETQTINFYHIDDALYYVDLPGYGYAKITLAVEEKWGKMIKNYLQKSPMLKMVFLPIDIRHGSPANDKTMYDWIIHNGYRLVIVATKPDKVNRNQVQEHVKMLRTGLGMEKEDVLIPFSAETKQEREEIWESTEEQMAD